MQSKHFFLDPQYRSIQPASTDQLAQPEPTSDELEYEDEQESNTELQKVAISQNRSRALLQTCALLLPVGLSFGILQLSFRHVYWRGGGEADGDPHGINEILGVLQLAAKVHEIFIVFSLSQLVLHYLRQQLISARGLPFGLFTSAYLVALGSHPLSRGFLYSWKSIFRRKHIQWQSFGLALLIVLATLVGLAAGPASAIALIPRLDWWSLQDLFTLYERPDTITTSDFTMYIPKRLFPHDVNSSSLPGPYCLNSGLDVNSSCPSAGYSDLLPTLNFTTGMDNITLDSPLRRIMSTRMNFEGRPTNESSMGGASTWTSNQVLANYLSLGWRISMDGVLGAPSTVETKTQHGSVMNPVVDVNCETQPATTYHRDLAFLHNPFSDPSGDDQSYKGTFDLREIWNETVLTNSSNTMLEWREMFQDAEEPVLAAFLLVPLGQNGFANITMCSVRAYWAANEMWIMSSESPTIISNFTWEGNDGYIEQHQDRPPPIRIRKEWADSLNAADHNSTSTVLANFINDGMRKYKEQELGLAWPAYGQSVMLSKAVADGLARIGSEYRVNYVVNRETTICRKGWCSRGPFLNPPLGPSILNGTVAEYDTYYPRLLPNNTGQILESFPEPADIGDVWTRIFFPVKRYGYGWGFGTVTIKVATAVLILHAAIIIIHSCILIFTGRSYSYASSLGELLALAFNSKPPATFKSTSVGISQGSTWARSTAVREDCWKEHEADRLKLVVEDLHKGAEKESLYRRPIVGKRYE